MTETRILIVNIHSAMNAGDRALLESTIQQLRTNFSNARFILSPNWPDEDYFLKSGYEIIPSPWVICGLTKKKIDQQIVSFLSGSIKAFLTGVNISKVKDSKSDSAWERLFDAYRTSDLVVGVAGNQFYSTGRYGWPFPVNLMAVSLAHKFRKPFYTMPQSIGPLRRRWEREMLRRAYQKSRFIQVRDGLSQGLAKEIGIPVEKTLYAPDPAFDYFTAPPDEAVELLKGYGYSPGKPCVGVSVIGSMGHSLPPGSISSYYQVMAFGLRKFIEENQAKVYLFNQVTGPTAVENDRIGSELVARSLMDLNGWVVNVDADVPPPMLKACYGLMDFFIASRLHSGIFALGMNIPSLFIGYLSKTRGVLSSIGLEDWVIDLENFTEETFYGKLKSVWEARHEMGDQLSRIMPGVKTQAQNAGRRIAEDFYSHV